MFWTNLVKGIGKALVVLGVIGSIIMGIAAGKAADSGLLGFLAIIIGIVVSFISVSGIMMICEISQNVYETKTQLTQQNGGMNASAPGSPYQYNNQYTQNNQ